MKALLQKLMSEIDWDGLEFFVSEASNPQDLKGTPLADVVPAFIKARQDLDLMLRALCEEHGVEYSL